MQIQTVLLIILAAILSLAIVLFQYNENFKKRGRTAWVLSFLRFISLFGVSLLLINPKFTKTEYSSEKANLVILADNSSSLKIEETSVKKALNEIHSNTALSEKFEFHQFSFGSSLGSDSLKFTEKETNISSALTGLSEIFANQNTILLLLTDGNQNIGQDYGFYRPKNNMSIFPIALGDTTRYEDLYVSQVNANRFAFLNNQFPLEIMTTYTGDKEVQSLLEVHLDGNRVYQAKIDFSKTKNSHRSTALLKAASVGVKNIEVSILPLSSERNSNNNHKKIAVEVIDEQTEIAIISNYTHPDIGTLKKAIESNDQRRVSIYKPTVDLASLNKTDIFIFYQPDASFEAIYKLAEKSKSGIFSISGAKTDWSFLNTVQNIYSKDSFDQLENVSPVLNPGFSLFSAEDFSINGYPPIESNLGEVQILSNSETLLYQKIKGAEIDEPLLTLIDQDNRRQAIFFGQNIWKWRMASFREFQNFENFDALIGKIMLFLSSNPAQERLNISYDNIYEGSYRAKISASFFDNAYEFNSDAELLLTTIETTSKRKVETPMVLKGRTFVADLSNMPAGTYDFTVSVKNEHLQKSGRFTILEFDLEKQLLTTDVEKLVHLADAANGEVFFPENIKELTNLLIDEQRFVPTQTSQQNIVSLIDFRVLLAILAISLATEWFIRKYIGLI